MFDQLGFSSDDEQPSAAADAQVAAMLAAGPSGQAAVELARLTPSMLSVAGRMDLIAAWQAQEAWAAAQTAACLAEHLGAEPDGPVMDAHTIEVDHEVLGWRMLLGETATVLRMAEGTLHRRYRIAWALATRLPATRAALQAGQIGCLHALAVAEATELLTDDQAAQVDRAVMRDPGRLSVATLRRRLRRAVIAADPDAAVAKARQAHADRGVRVWSDPDGAGHLEAWSDHRDTWCLKQAVDLLAGPREANDPGRWIRGGSTPSSVRCWARSTDTPANPTSPPITQGRPMRSSQTTTGPGDGAPAVPAAGRGGGSVVGSRCRWWSTWPPWPGWPTAPDTCPGTGRSRPASSATGWPMRRRGGGW